MSAVLIRMRAEMRARWRAWLALTLLAGVAAGIVVAASAGARRTASAYDRLVATSDAVDFVLGSTGGNTSAFERVEALPDVIDTTRVFLAEARITGAGGATIGFPDVFPLVDPAGRYGIELNRFKILEGRMFRASDPSEAVLSVGVAERFGVRAGDRMRLEHFATEPASGRPVGDPIVSTELTITGIEAAPGEFQGLSSGAIPALHLSPAFHRAFAPRFPQLFPADSAALVVRVAPGRADALLDALEEGGVAVDPFFVGSEMTKGVNRAIGFQAAALWGVAALGGLAAIAMFGQSVARQTLLESAEHPALRALGMSRGQLVLVGMARAALSGIVAAAAGAAVSLALSPLMPFGLAGVAEPDPGFHADALALGVGAAATLVLVLAVSAWPVWRAATAAGRGAAAPRPSRVPAALGRAGLPPGPVAGVWMALGPGRGSVPARSAVLGTLVGILALVASLVFSSSMSHLVETPRLSGWNWDAALAAPDSEPQTLAAAASAVAADPDVSELSRAVVTDVQVGRELVFAFAVFPERGSIGLAMIEGRPPAAADEVALGTDTMRNAGVGIGDRVEIRGLDFADDGGERRAGSTERMRVVGRFAMPTFFFGFNRPGQGSAFTLDGLRRFRPQAEADSFLVRFRDGADLDAAVERMTARGPLFPVERGARAEAENVRRVSSAPLVLAGMLAAMAAGTLAHTLLTSARRRRRDLAILKTLGFERRQVRGAVAWHAGTIAALALGLGVPAGIAAGRWGWHALADRLGVVPEIAIDVAAVGIAAAATVVLARLIAALPGRAAARTRPALVLRAE